MIACIELTQSHIKLRLQAHALRLHKQEKKQRAEGLGLARQEMLGC